MDGYLYNLDPYRQASAGYYAPRYTSSYALERRSSSGLPASDPYARVPIDPYAGYGALPSYQPDVVLRPRYASPPTSPPFRPRPRTGPKRKPPPAQNLGPKKKPFKQTQRVRFSEERGRPSKKPSQTATRVEKPNAKAGKGPKSQTASLAKETQELHSLYRTGVDPKTGKKFEEIARKNGEGKKRKAETQTQKSTPVQEAAGSAKKKQKGKKNKKSTKDKKNEKPEASTPAAQKAVRKEPYTLTEEEKKEAEVALELQRGLCESVCECLGVPLVLEKPETKEGELVSELDAKPADSKETEKPLKAEEPQLTPEEEKEAEEKYAKPADSKETEKPSKPEEPQRTPEEEKEAEEKSFAFFSKLFEENQELRKLYVDKCNSGSFECLVCYSTDAKSNKQFWNLVSLVMHSKMTKPKQPEHRGYGRAVSAIFGWDPLNTPKVPRNHRLTTANKPTEQVIEEKKPETDGKTVDSEEKEANATATEELKEEKAAEASSKDLIEE